jgi:ubiquinone/menaquinone biosynthesis C-methylase UbiE
METKAYKGMGMEGGIARWYEKTTRKDLGEFQTLARRMAATLPEGARVLEVAPGPGFFAIALAKLEDYEIIGLDISKTFVEIARKNARAEGARVNFEQGDAANMPFEDRRFDLIMCRAAFKNFSEPVRALQEMRRVLKPGGRAVIIDLRKDAPIKEIDAHVDRMGLGATRAFMTKWTFRLMLLKRAYTREQFEGFIAQSGFSNYDIREANVGFEITLAE